MLVSVVDAHVRPIELKEPQGDDRQEQVEREAAVGNNLLDHDGMLSDPKPVENTRCLFDVLRLRSLVRDEISIQEPQHVEEREAERDDAEDDPQRRTPLLAALEALKVLIELTQLVDGRTGGGGLACVASPFFDQLEQVVVEPPHALKVLLLSLNELEMHVDDVDAERDEPNHEVHRVRELRVGFPPSPRLPIQQREGFKSS